MEAHNSYDQNNGDTHFFTIIRKTETHISLRFLPRASFSNNNDDNTNNDDSANNNTNNNDNDNDNDNNDTNDK